MSDLLRSYMMGYLCGHERAAMEAIMKLSTLDMVVFGLGRTTAKDGVVPFVDENSLLKAIGRHKQLTTSEVDRIAHLERRVTELETALAGHLQPAEENEVPVDEMRTTINMGNDFSVTPGGRYIDDGPDSAELFRDKFLIPALNKYEKVVLDLGGTVGYTSAFLEEVFGGSVRVLAKSTGEDMTTLAKIQNILNKLRIITNSYTLHTECWGYLHAELERLNDIYNGVLPQ